MKPISDIEKLREQVETLRWAVVTVIIVSIITFLVLLHLLREQVRTERIEVMSVSNIERAPHEAKSYICTNGVRVEDLREACGGHKCNLWFHGKGECAVVLP